MLNELTKEPFEPMKDKDKTAFLLALTSVKRRSEIHVWVANNLVSNLGQWENSVASRTRFTRDRALIRLQMRIVLESAGTKIYENV